VGRADVHGYQLAGGGILAELPAGRRRRVVPRDNPCSPSKASSGASSDLTVGSPNPAMIIVDMRHMARYGLDDKDDPPQGSETSV
jgi:hypothetical protein